MIGLANRTKFIEENQNTIFDLIVIGGGITGAGILLDASSRGKKCLLIEKNDFASGTSSKSTKLIHGGLRYLKNLEFKMVSDVGRERNIAFRNAPHLVRPEKMLIPLYKKKGFKKWQLSIALKLYDILANVRKKDRRKILSRKATLELESKLNGEKLIGGGCYAEYRTDDARLTISLIKTAKQYNAGAINYMEVKSINKTENFNISCFDHVYQKNITLHSKNLINATGPWADKTRLLQNEKFTSNIHLSKGIHIVVSKEVLPLKQALYYTMEDDRMCFAIPRGAVTYIGTTDDDYHGNINDIKISNEEVKYLINGANKVFNSSILEPKHVISSWAGLRPLIKEPGKKSTEISRKDEIFLSKSGMISIAGGKLTGYRLMAKKAVDMIDKKNQCKTHLIAVDGNFNNDYESYQALKVHLCNEFEIDKLTSNYLIQNYGTNAISILKDFKSSYNNLLICCELKYCIDHEGVNTLLDFYVRRTGLMYFNPIQIEKSLDKVVEFYNNTISKYGIEKADKNLILDELKASKNFI